jgi:hypothetical protein
MNKPHPVTIRVLAQVCWLYQLLIILLWT